MTKYLTLVELHVSVAVADSIAKHYTQIKRIFERKIGNLAIEVTAFRASSENAIIKLTDPNTETGDFDRKLMTAWYEVVDVIKPDVGDPGEPVLTYLVGQTIRK